MKKYLKFIIIALLVIAAVTLTCVLFFTNYQKRKETEVRLTDIYANEERIEFSNSLSTTNSAIINSDGTDARFNNVIATIENLDSSVKFLASIYVENDSVVKSREVGKILDDMNENVSLANDIMKEMNIKAFIRDDEGNIISNNIYYNRHLGANDLYTCLSDYVVDYVKLIKIINNNIDANKSLDVRFSAIELYLDVVIDTFSVVEVNNSNLMEIKNKSNLELVNRCYLWNGVVLTTNTAMFSASNNNFIKFYNLSNKAELAKNLNTMYSDNSLVANPTNEQQAIIYFKEVFGR